MPESSRIIGPKLLKALGINETNVIRAQINLHVSAPVTVFLERYAEPANIDEAVDELASEAKQFTLIETIDSDHQEDEEGGTS